MPFKLYKDDEMDPPRRQVSFDDLENKSFWCRLGEAKEKAFVAVMQKIGLAYTVKIHPNKAHDPYHPDLLVEKAGKSYVGEVKIKNSPLFFGRRYGVNPQFALTMDLKDSFNYTRMLEEGLNLFIFIWVKWEAHEMITWSRGQKRVYRVEPMRGIWLTRFSKLRAKEKSALAPGIHWYKESFRLPAKLDPRLVSVVEADWCRELCMFEPRLCQPDGKVKNITSLGFTDIGGMRHPAGQSSGSYVFDLSDRNLFDELYFKMH